jgi:hypothetical protein
MPYLVTLNVVVLLVLVSWTWRRLGPPWQKAVAAPVPAPASAVAALAIELCQKHQAMPDGASGEFKRHRVYAALMKAFPTTPHRALSRAIEDALREIPEA